MTAPTSAAGASPPSAPPSTASVTSWAYPYLAGGPRIEVGSGISASASSSAKRKSARTRYCRDGGSNFRPKDQPGAAAAKRGAARPCRRVHGHERRGRPDWAAPRTEEPDASTAGSGSSAGPLGFAGTVPKGNRTDAAGLTRLAGDEFGGGQRRRCCPAAGCPITLMTIRADERFVPAAQITLGSAATRLGTQR